MGVLIAKAMGNKATVVSTSDKKKSLAEKLGADNYVISKDPQSMKSAARSLDLILDTISAGHELMPYLELLKKKGTLVVLGVTPTPLKVIYIYTTGCLFEIEYFQQKDKNINLHKILLI